jgi:hypothetical protein
MIISARRSFSLCLAACLLPLGCGDRDKIHRRGTTAAPVSSSANPSSPAPVSAGTGATTGGASTTGSVTTATAPAPSAPSGCVNPGDDHGDDFATATLIDLRSPFAGQIEVSCDTDAFLVTLRGGVSYDFVTITGDDTTLTVLDAQGLPVAFNDNAGPNLLSSKVDAFVPQADDDYLVLINGFTSPLPRYTLRVYPTGVLQMPRLERVELDDRDGSGTASQYDLLIATYTEEVRFASFGSPAAHDELSPQVLGDDLGAGAAVALGPASNQITVTLGAAPFLTVSGVFDGNRLALNDPSGADITLRALISSARTGFPPARWAVDVTPSPPTSGSAAGGS